MTSVVIWHYRENKINLSFKGGGACHWDGGLPPEGNVHYVTLINVYDCFSSEDKLLDLICITFTITII